MCNYRYVVHVVQYVCTNTPYVLLLPGFDLIKGSTPF